MFDPLSTCHFSSATHAEPTACIMAPSQSESQPKMTITCNGRSQTCISTMIYRKSDDSTALYQVNNQWFTLYGYLPSRILRAIPSTYTLPKRFVVKIKYPDSDDVNNDDARSLIQREKEAYGRMQDLQGNVIPDVWFDVVVEGFEKYSFAMELLEGDNLFNLSTPLNPNRPQLDVDLICSDICGCFRAISKYNMQHWDVDDLANIMLVQRPLRQNVVPEVICFTVLLLSRGNHFLTTLFLALWITSLLNSWWKRRSRVVLIDWEMFYYENDKDVFRINQSTARNLSDLLRERYSSVHTDIPSYLVDQSWNHEGLPNPL